MVLGSIAAAALAGGGVALGHALPHAETLALGLSPAPNTRSDIYLLEVDSGRLVNLTRSPNASERLPVWSPDGSRIAYLVQTINTQEVYLIELEGQRKQPLYSMSFGNFGPPRWSPDGEQLVFWLENAEMGATGLYALKPDAPEAERGALWNPGSRSNLLLWSPDGQQVVVNEGMSIKVMPAGCVATPETCAARMLSDSAAFVSWSPDGLRIAFSQIVNGYAESLYTVAPDGSDLRRLNAEQVYLPPAWSPDSQHLLVFSMMCGSSGCLYRLNSDGTGLYRYRDIDTSSFSWSPRGDRIAFITLHNVQNAQAYLMNADGTNIRPLTDYIAWAGSPAWEP
jgi:TolB protein